MLFGHRPPKRCRTASFLSSNPTSPTMTNPIPADGLPAFSQIRPEHALPAVEHGLENCRQVIRNIETLGENVNYENVLEAEQLADHILGNAWSTISHLHSVNNTDERRQANSRRLETQTRFRSEERR